MIFINGNTELLTNGEDFDGFEDEATLDAVDTAVKYLRYDCGLKNVEVDDCYQNWTGGSLDRGRKIQLDTCWYYIAVLDKVDKKTKSALDNADKMILEILTTWKKGE